MKRSCDTLPLNIENNSEKKVKTSVILPSEFVSMDLSVIDLQSECVTEVVHTDTSDLTKNDDNTTMETNFEIITEYMDITQPLTALRGLLEQRTNQDLSEYSFFLQDNQELDATKNLVHQCVQGEGLVQINLIITDKDGIKKINILDVLKPAEEIPLSPIMSTPDSSNSQKVLIPSSNDSQVTCWTVASDFKHIQDKLKMPQDPALWTYENVKQWIQWAVVHFNLLEVDINDWNISGKELMSLTTDDISKKIPFDPGDLFRTHLELLRKFKIIAVIQQPTLVQSVPDINNGQKTGSKTRQRSTKIGTPRISYEGCLGNHSAGNNGQIQLWQFLLELLTDKDHQDYIQWVGNEGEFKLINPEMVAQLWGQRKNKPTMNYEKLSRALRYYYDGEMIAKVHGKRFVYKFVCDLKSLLGYDASELNRLVSQTGMKQTEKHQLSLRTYTTINVDT